MESLANDNLQIESINNHALIERFLREEKRQLEQEIRASIKHGSPLIEQYPESHPTISRRNTGKERLYHWRHQENSAIRHLV